MSTIVTADVLAPSVDTTRSTIDQGYDGVIRPGWPCATPASDPPSVADLQAAPTADGLLPQVLALAPRGPAWGTDEAGDGRGASPIMRRFWQALAAWSARNNALEFDLATQVFPSAIGFSLPDWETELGLPDTCFVGGSGVAARIAAVRARFGAQGGQSPAYFICLAAAVGYDITITEPTQFLVDMSALAETGLSEGWFHPDAEVVSGASLVEGYFRIDDGEIEGDPLESFALLPEAEGSPLETFTLSDAVEADLDEVANDPIVETGFEIDASEIDDARIDGYSMAATLDGVIYSQDEWKYWVVTVGSLGETFFHVDEGELAYDPIEGFNTAVDLECLMRRYAPPHTSLIFAYPA